MKREGTNAQITMKQRNKETKNSNYNQHNQIQPMIALEKKQKTFDFD